MKDLLEVLRVQRHNFLNHLQVISGLLQLKKHDRALEYIRQVGEEYNQASLVGRMEVPELVGAILVGEHEAAKQGVSLNKRIATNLERGLRNPEKVAQLMNGMLKVSSDIAQTNFDDKWIDLSIEELEDNYVIHVFCKSPSAVSADSFSALLTSAEALSQTGNPLQIVLSDEGVVMTLTVMAAA